MGNVWKMTCAMLAVAVVNGVALQASAAGWASSEDKGLKIYAWDNGSERLELVCDPEGLWEPAEFHLVVTRGGKTLAGESVKVSRDDLSLDLPLASGAVLGRDKESWNKLIGVLEAPGAITVTAQGTPMTFDLTEGLTGDCRQSQP